MYHKLLFQDAAMGKSRIRNLILDGFRRKQMMDELDLRSSACWNKLGISSSSFYEIKYRLGYRDKITLEQFNDIERTVEEIRRRYGMVVLGTINRYFEYVEFNYGKEKNIY